jgi:aspartate carbamoyltransferase regulatory subunit
MLEVRMGIVIKNVPQGAGLTVQAVLNVATGNV